MALGRLKGKQYFYGVFPGNVNGNTGTWHLIG
jgi:hypothetical protein